jgi:hypothetical protein
VNPLRKGDYVVCRFNGSRNGDLIVGVVESVRSHGRIVLKNLLTEKPSLKRVDVLLRRNAVVPKRVAVQIATNFKSHKSVPFARLEALKLAAEYDPVKKDRVVDLVSRFNALTADDQQRFSRRVWPTVLSAFGVD